MTIPTAVGDGCADSAATEGETDAEETGVGEGARDGDGVSVAIALGMPDASGGRSAPAINGTPIAAMTSCRREEQDEATGSKATAPRCLLQDSLTNAWRDRDGLQGGAQDDVVAPHPGGRGSAARASSEMLLERGLFLRCESFVDPLRREQEVGLVVVHVDCSPLGDRISRSRIRARQM